MIKTGEIKVALLGFERAYSFLLSFYLILLNLIKLLFWKNYVVFLTLSPGKLKRLKW